MSNILRNKKYYELLLVIFFGLFVLLRSDPFNISVEKNIYDYYSESIVKDHDLNVMNQVPPKERWQMTASGNYPDVHSNGIISFWYPFYIYKHLIEKSLPIDNQQAIFLTRSLATSFFSLLSLIFLIYWIKKVMEFSFTYFEIITFFLGISFFWFAIFQPGNADITSLFVALLELILFKKIIKENKSYQYFIFGLLLGIGLTLKIDHFFFLMLPLYLFFTHLRNGLDRKTQLKNFVLFGLGYVFNIIPLLINDTIKFGYTDYGYREVLNFDYYLLWENLFYPSGFLNNNPIFIFSFLGLLLLILEKNKNYELIFIGMIPVVSILTESFARIHQESYGSRHWIAYLPSLFLLYLYFFKKIKKTKLFPQIVITILLLLAIVQNFNKLIRSILNYEKFYFGADQWGELVVYFKQMGLKGLVTGLFNFPQIDIKIYYFYPVILICLVILVISFKFLLKEGREAILAVYGVIVFTTISYSVMTYLNISNNQFHYQAFKKTGVLKNTIIGNGPHIHSLFENLGTTEKAIKFYQFNENSKKVEFFKKLRFEYLNLSAQEILYDPVGFKEKLLTNKASFIDDELRVD